MSFQQQLASELNEIINDVEKDHGRRAEVEQRLWCSKTWVLLKVPILIVWFIRNSGYCESSFSAPKDPVIVKNNHSYVWRLQFRHIYEGFLKTKKNKLRSKTTYWAKHSSILRGICYQWQSMCATGFAHLVTCFATFVPNFISVKSDPIRLNHFTLD